METDDEIAAPVLGPVVVACRAMGLDIADPVVLGAGANVVAHLAPSPVVVRIATLTAEMRGGAAAYLARERDICNALLDRGVDVIGPTDLVDPGPHDSDGLGFLLLRHRRFAAVDLGSTEHAEAAGRALAGLLSALADLPDHLATGGGGQPWKEISTLLRTVEPAVDGQTMSRLTAAVGGLQATEPDDPWQLVHGDAHRTNVGLVNGGALWFDLEDANRRPAAWDLATLYRTWPAAGLHACRLLDVDHEGPSMRWHYELRELYALLWNLLYGQRYERARRASARRLTRWLTRPSP